MRKKATLAGTRDALKIIDRMIGDNEEMRRRIEEETLNCLIAQMIYEARTRAALTQAQLAALIGTRQPVIARLEDADYRGHSLSMLQRIANALNLQLTVQLTPPKRKRA